MEKSLYSIRLYPVPIFLLFTLLGLLYTWPLALYIFDGIPFSYKVDPAFQVSTLFVGDHLQAYYHLGLMNKAATGAIDLFSNPYEFATDHGGQFPSSHFLPVSIIYLPFSFISLTFGYNMMLLASFGLAGLAAYLWVSDLTGSRIAGVFGGIVFNLLPLRLVELYGGHPAGHAIFLFPLALFFFDRAVKLKSPAWSALAGLAVLGFSFQYLYFCYYLLLFFLVYIPWRTVPIIREAIAKGNGELTRFLVAGVPFATGLAATVWVMLSFKKGYVDKSAFPGGRGMDEIALFSPKISEIWAPGASYSVYLGVATFLGVAAILYGLSAKKDKEPARRDILFFSTVFVLTYILAFGLSLHDHFPLYSLFYKTVPAFKFSRAPAKIMIITVTILAALAGYLVTAAIRNKKRVWILALALALVGVMIDYHPKKDIGLCLMDENNPVYATLAQKSGGSKVLNIPIWPGESAWESIYEYYALQSEVPMINGYSPVVSKTFTEKVFWPLAPVNSGDIGPEQARLIKELGVSHVIFHEEAYPAKISAYPPRFVLEKLLNSPYLTLVEGSEPLWLFAVTDDPTETFRHPVESKSPFGAYFVAAGLPRIKGKVEKTTDTASGFTLVGEPGVSGFLNAGPYRTFPSGRYRAAFRIKVEGSFGDDDHLATLDVTSDKGRKVVTQKEIRGADFTDLGRYQLFWLEYNLPPGPFWQIELRTKSTGAAKILLDTLYVVQASAKDPLGNVEAEELYYYGAIAEDNLASGKEAVLFSPKKSPRTKVLYGPARRLEAGEYEASYYMKGRGVGKTVARVAVYSLGARKIIAERSVGPDDISEEYKKISLRFKVSHFDAVEFQVFYESDALLWLDRIEVTPVKESRLAKNIFAQGAR